MKNSLQSALRSLFHVVFPLGRSKSQNRRCHVIILLESLPLMQLLVKQAGRPRTRRRPYVHVCTWKQAHHVVPVPWKFWDLLRTLCSAEEFQRSVCVFCECLPAPPKNCGSHVPDSCRWVIYVQVSALAINFISRRQRNMIVKSQSRGGRRWEGENTIPSMDLRSRSHWCGAVI